MQEVFNSVPFVLKKGGHQIEVVDAMAAEILDMETISDFFEPSAPTLVDYLWGFFTGKQFSGIFDQFLWNTHGYVVIYSQGIDREVCNQQKKC